MLLVGWKFEFDQDERHPGYFQSKMFDVFSKFDETFGHDMCSTLSLRVLGTSQVPKVPFFGKCVIEASFFRGRA